MDDSQNAATAAAAADIAATTTFTFVEQGTSFSTRMGPDEGWGNRRPFRAVNFLKHENKYNTGLSHLWPLIKIYHFNLYMIQLKP